MSGNDLPMDTKMHLMYYGMNDKDEKRFTVQGRDTLILVAESNGKAGSLRSSARDCGSREVELQISGSENDTRKRELVDLFQRRDSLRRTPPKVIKGQNIKYRRRGSVSTGGKDGGLDFITSLVNTDEEDELFSDRAPKRKRIGTPEKGGPSKKLKELRGMVKKLSLRA